MPRRRLGPVVLVFVSCVLLVSARDLPPRHVAQALPRVGLLWHGPAMQGPMLALRGGQSNEADGETAAPSAAAAAGAGVVRKWEDRDGDSRSGDEEDDEEKWDYGKFGMTEPVVEDGQSLNAEMTGCEGEPGYIGADPFIGKWGWTALHRAACEGDSGTLRKMLEMGGDANVVTHNGWTPLIEAASEGHTECVKVLLHFGANVSLPTRGGWSPLHFAVGNGHMETIQELLKNGADPLWQDCYGDYPMDKAMRSAELDYPTLPLRCNVSMPVADRKALYYAAAAAVNVTAQRAHEMNFSRFSLYAEPIAGKRYSYDLDFAAEGEEHQVPPPCALASHASRVPCACRRLRLASPVRAASARLIQERGA